MQKNSDIESYWCSPDSGKVKLWMKKEAAWSPDDPAWNARPDVTFVREFLAPRFSGRRVLDLGGGSGRWVHLWRRCDCELMSVDWSPPFLEVLASRSEAADARWGRLDVNDASLPETFDLVFASMFLLHLHPDRIRGALANIDRMARRHLCFTTWEHPDGFDAGDTAKVQSFSHDYQTLFREIGWRPVLDFGVDYRSEGSSGRNGLCFLEKSQD